MKMRWRATNFIGLLLIIILFTVALGAEYYQHLNPCPLCIMQRLAYIALGIVFLIFICLPIRRWIIKFQGILMLIASLAGLSIALRQLYLQHLPAGMAPSCGPGFNYLFANFPWHQAIQMVLQGSGECAVVDWRLLGLSMAAWSALWFVFFCLWGLILLFKKMNFYHDIFYS